MDLSLYILASVFGLVALVYGADRFVTGAAALAHNLGVSALIIGLTIVGFGTSAPEILVSGVASLEGRTELSIGNAIGSNITNIALVLGLAAMYRPLWLHIDVIRRETPVLLVAMAGCVLLLWDQHLGRLDAVILLIALVGMIAWVVREGMAQYAASIASNTPNALNDEFDEDIPHDMRTAAALCWVALGAAVLLLGARGLVWGSVHVALFFEVDELIIGLTVLAFGTSLPELAASLMAVRKNQHDIAIGNIIGSNMFNLLGVLAVPGLLQPGPFSRQILTRDYTVMLGVTVWLLLMMGLNYHRGKKLSRWQGGVLFGVYFLYIGALTASKNLP